MAHRAPVADATEQVMTSTSRAILAIAGSDPSGGAGIQADLKTCTSLGVYAGAAITCLTVQNSRGVYGVHPVEPELVKDQIRKVLADLPISHIKTGMIGTGKVARAIGECLADFDGIVICDPVIKASDGHDLLPAKDLDILREQIIARATALTPNFHEFKALSALDSDKDKDITSAAAKMFSQYPRLEAIIIKGGHRLENQPAVIDSLFIRGAGGIRKLISERARIKSSNTHGTGCTYASALAAYHLKTGNWPEAFQLAADYVAELLRLSVDLKMGSGTGPLWHHLFTERDRN